MSDVLHALTEDTEALSVLHAALTSYAPYRLDPAAVPNALTVLADYLVEHDRVISERAWDEGSDAYDDLWVHPRSNPYRK